MANSKIPDLNLSDTLNASRLKFNQLLDSVGNVSSLTTTSKEVTGAIKELDAELGTISAGAMGTTASTVSTAIAEIDTRLDSINATYNNDNLTLNNLTVNGIANLDSTNLVGQLDVTGTITAQNFTVSGAFTTTGATRNVASFQVVNDGVAVTNTNRAGLAVDRPSADSAVVQWNELGDFWEIGTNQTDGGSSSDLKRIARQNDSAVFSNLMQSGTGATRIPAGTTAQRPSAEQGQIRYNTSNSSFEGYSGSAWAGLGGLIDVDGDTKIIAERSASNDSDTLTFFTAGVERLRMNDSGSTFATNISGTTATFSGNITMTGTATVDGRDLATDGTKLDGIESSATADQTGAQIKSAYEGEGDTNAFTDALLTKLNGIAASANNYSHPTHAGDDISVDTGALSGATVISDLDFNVTTDTEGHVTDANGSVATRTITLANLGYTGATNANNFSYTHPSHPGDDISIDTTALTGATVISDLDFNVTTDTEGHVTDANGSVATRSLTATDVGATPTGSMTLGRTNAGASGGSILYLNSSSGEIQFQAATASKASMTSSQDGSGYGQITFSTRNQVGAGDAYALALTIYNGNLTVQGDVNSISDVRTKENIITVEGGLDLVSQLRGVWYNKIDHDDRKVGVIAQEVEEVLPEVVNTDGDGIKSVDYGKMVGVLIEAIKELKQEIEELKG